jgi:hypothetical protein
MWRSPKPGNSETGAPLRIQQSGEETWEARGEKKWGGECSLAMAAELFNSERATVSLE